MKKFLIGILIASALVVTVPMAGDVLEDGFNENVEEFAAGDASFRIRSVGPTLP